MSFTVLGVSVSSWTARSPELVRRLRIEPSSFALLLALVALAGVVVLPFAGLLIGRWGTARVLRGGAFVVAASLGCVAVAFAVGSWVLLALGLSCLGMITGLWDVAVAVTVTDLEARTGRSLLARAYAAFSVGAITGGVFGWLAIACRVPVSVHLAGVICTVVLAMQWVAGNSIGGVGVIVSLRGDTGASGGSGRKDGVGAAVGGFRAPKTFVVGVVAFTFAVMEGAGSNWIAIAASRDRGLAVAVATLLYVLFLVSTTTGRWFAGSLSDRFASSNLLRAAAGTSAVGIVTYALLPLPAGPPIGVVLWGLGISIGIPLCVGAVGREGPAAASGISVVTSLAYAGYLVGPPGIGLAAKLTGLTDALPTVGVPLLIIAMVLARAIRPRTRSRSTISETELP
ncbi:MFS transporter [Curtobacterium sp. VKM Ac-2887]|uniref:MFS transporter n=1 Tax=Curtobacterium sp. VKM Ac-2887 TaxID=2783819 RepID=UPI00188BCADC|nr:MFS transporter [Curtobacterium sp. VKM Ac-2887]MBF4588429.1 MFS transporter [Curtobacterium sp. VKM Ac-2887]